MNDFEKVVQKNIITLVKYLPTHVTTWSTILDDISRPLQVLSNQSEQLRCVDSANIDWMENFKQIQGSLSHKISREISDTLIELKLKINQLKQVNNDLKTKVLTLEQSSLAIDWNSSSRIVKGSPTQPSLENLLDHCLRFLTFFLEIGEKIYNAFNNLEVKKPESVQLLRESFKVNLSDSTVTYLIAITQYIDKNIN
ncbi:hypothetical protein WA026_023351 [Henosepilachna vigintioctopunctata]|uniref:Uncharacterized protein n=1 Tax=Henosepilachna vigintioctopunctata TaxID=420089 RepID=A0AAW1VDW7_9CUCU